MTFIFHLNIQDSLFFLTAYKFIVEYQSLIFMVAAACFPVSVSVTA